MSPERATLPLPGVRWRGLTVQLFVTVVLPLTGLLIAVALGAAYLHQQAMRDLVGERDRRAVVSLARALEEQLEQRATAVQALARLLDQGLEPSRALTVAQVWQSDMDAGLALLGPDRTPQATTQPPPAWLIALDDLPPAVWQAAGPTFVAVPGQEDPRVTLVVAPRAAGQGWVIAGFDPAALAQATLRDAFPETATARLVLLDAQGHRLFAQPPSQDTTYHPAAEEAWRGRQGVRYLHTPDGEHVVAYSAVRPVGWALVLEETWAEVASPWLHTTQLAPLLLVPVLLLALTALWFGARQVVEPLQRLEAQAQALAWGDYAALDTPVGGIEEIQRLQRALRHMAHRLQRAHEALHSYIGAITQAQEEERRRLARELHDETVQDLIALQQRLQLVRRSLPADAPAQTALAELQRLAQRAMRELRRMTHDLRPLYLEDLGLVPALETLAQEMQSQNPDLQVEVLVQGQPRRLEPAHELALYRIAQEALRNIVRHANATWAQVRLRFGPRQVKLEIQDNGRGFEVPESPAAFAAQGHYGLLGMYERADLIAARLSLHAEPGQGTRVELVLPLDTPPPNGLPAHPPNAAGPQASSPVS